MKRFLAAILCVLLVMGTAACGQTENAQAQNSGTQSTAEAPKETGNKKMKIGFSIALRDQWLTTLETAAKKKAEENGIDFTVYDADSDVQKQLSHITTMATQKFDVMIVNLVNSDNAPEIISTAGDIPIVFVNRLPNQENLVENKIVYVGSDENTSGKLQGEYLAKYFKEKGKTEINYVLLMGTLGLQHTTARTASAKKALEDGGIKGNEVFEDTANYERATAQQKMQQFIGTGKSFDAVICNNDEMALGVIEALKAANIEAPVTGIDATENALEAVKSGEMACSVFQNAVGQGEGMIDAAVKLAKGESCEKLNWVPFELVTKDNVEEYFQKVKGN
ncbi:substrate-binding domain-containing protein [Caproiciproducens sp. R2]|uniref:substrate-binding domain-containing protein n=1 Tax=Caproiciproducens sp. R2 TaxID=3435187 RepID=UPI004033C242